MKSLTLLALTLTTNICFSKWYKTTTETIPIYRLLNGEIEAVNKTTVSAQTTGRIKKLNYDVDDFVSKDSIIVEITNTEQKAALNQAESNANAAKIAYQQSVTDFERIKDIYEKKLIAKSQFDLALSTKNAFEAQYKAAQSAVISAKKQQEYTIIRAPYDGIVTKRFIELGEVVNPGSAIMEGLSLNKLRVATQIPEKIIHQVKANPTAEVIINNKQFNTKDITFFPYADSMTRTFKTRIDLDTGNTSLFPGMTVKIAFKVGEKQSVLIPHTSIINRSELTLVYVKDGNNKLLRHIKIGSSYKDTVEIISGLTAGEEILLNPLNEMTGE